MTYKESQELLQSFFIEYPTMKECKSSGVRIFGTGKVGLYFEVSSNSTEEYPSTFKGFDVEIRRGADD